MFVPMDFAYNLYYCVLSVLNFALFLYEAKTVVAQVHVQWYFYRENGASSTIVLSCKQPNAFIIIGKFIRKWWITGEKSKQLNVPTDDYLFVRHLRPVEIARENNMHSRFRLFIFHGPRCRRRPLTDDSVWFTRESFADFCCTHTVRTLWFDGIRTKKSKNHTYTIYACV